MTPELDTLDALIDHTLAALRQAEPSSTLEARILTRLAAQPAATRQALQTRWLLWAAPLTAAALIAAAVALHAHHQAVAPNLLAQDLSASRSPKATPAPDELTTHSLTTHDWTEPVFATEASSPASSSNASQTAPQDPEAALALAETQAASLSAPTMPLSAEERTLLRAMRSADLSQLADLQPAREAGLRAALEAREQLAIDQYVHRLLAPLAASETIQPTEPTAAESTAAESLPAGPAETTSIEPNP